VNANTYNCHSSAVLPPKGTTYPYEFVSQIPAWAHQQLGHTDPWTYDPVTGKDVDNPGTTSTTHGFKVLVAEISLPRALTVAQLEGFVAHEEGHNNWSENCDKCESNNAPPPEGNYLPSSVMGRQDVRQINRSRPQSVTLGGIRKFIQSGYQSVNLRYTFPGPGGYSCETMASHDSAY
jgi:hypothetical protein